MASCRSYEQLYFSQGRSAASDEIHRVSADELIQSLNSNADGVTALGVEPRLSVGDRTTGKEALPVANRTKVGDPATLRLIYAIRLRRRSPSGSHSIADNGLSSGASSGRHG